jgi:hypothetical protein
LKLTINRPSLTGYQKEILYNDSRFTITEASTKAGKTYSHVWWIYERAHEPFNKPNYQHWWVAPVYSQAKIAFSRLREKIGRTGIYKINESNLTITTPLGSVISFKSAEKPDHLYGDDVHSIVFDEAPRARVEAFYALRTTITATGGKMKMIGNYGGSNNWLHLLKEKSKSDTNYFYKKITVWDAVEAGILKREEIEQAQRDLPPSVFKMLYMAEDADNKDRLATDESINDLFTNTHVLDGDRYITADIAFQGSDLFVLLVWSGWKIIDSRVIEKSTGREVEDLIKVMAELHSVGRSNISYDSDGVGMYLTGYLTGATPYHSKLKANENYAHMNAQCSYLLAKKINDKSIYISDSKLLEKKQDVVTQLQCLIAAKLNMDGKLDVIAKKEIKDLIGCSPDYLDAMKMRMIFEINKKCGAVAIDFM